MATGKRWAVKGFFGFLAAMAVCTVLSRAAASALVAQVEVKRPGRGRLSYTCEGTGNVVPGKEKKIFLWEGQQVEWSAAKGSTVKKGKCLVKFRKEYLDKAIEKKESEVTQLKLQAKEQQISSREQARVPTAESAAQALSEAEKKLRMAQKKEKKAKEAWEAYKEYRDSKTPENSSGSAAGDSADSGAGGENDGSDHSGSDSGGNHSGNGSGGDHSGNGSGSNYSSSGNSNAARKQELKEAYQAAKAETEAARQERSQARGAYDLAKKEDAAQDKNSANAREAALTGVQAAVNQAEAAEKELKLLRRYRKAGGKIVAENDCRVLENSVQTGIITGGTEYLLLGYGGWKLKGELAEEDKDEIAPGTEAAVEFASGRKAEAVIKSVNTSDESTQEGKEKEAAYVWYGTLPDEAESGEAETFTWKTEAESEEEYEQMIPISALREDMDGAYCLIVSEKEKMLGKVQIAKRVPVTVIEKDGKNAAVTSELGREDQVIVSSEKFVSGGDRIRIKE